MKAVQTPEDDVVPDRFNELAPETRKMLARMEPYEVQALCFFFGAAKAGRLLALTLMAVAGFVAVMFGAITAVRSALGRSLW